MIEIVTIIIISFLVVLNAGIALYYWFKSEVYRGIIEHLEEILEAEEIQIG